MMLFAALECFDHGDYIGAGVRLREAVARFLTAAAEWHAVKAKGKHPRPAAIARALCEAGHMGEWTRDCILEIIEIGNRAAHCGKVEAGEIRGNISLLFAMMDGEPYVDFARVPDCTTYQSDCESDCNDDDDDAADGWKGGAI